MVVKKDGSRETFDREKIRAGFRRACEKRPVSTETIDAAVDSIEKRMQEMCVKEIDSRQVGEAVMEELRKVDKIAYVRFASVYREFSDVEQFVDALQSLGGSSESREKEPRSPRKLAVVETTRGDVRSHDEGSATTTSEESLRKVAE